MKKMTTTNKIITAIYVATAIIIAFAWATETMPIIGKVMLVLTGVAAVILTIAVFIQLMKWLNGGDKL